MYKWFLNIFFLQMVWEQNSGKEKTREGDIISKASQTSSPVYHDVTNLGEKESEIFILFWPTDIKRKGQAIS